MIRYKDKHLGQRCFIIENGPSLKAEDLNKIEKEYSFGCNKIYKIFTETKWRPTYYFVEDSLAYKNNYKEIKTFPFPKFISDLALDRGKLHLVNNGIKFFDYIYYWNTYPKDPPLTVDLTKEVWSAYNVGYQMLNAAIYLGFKDIYLIGMDFSYDFTNAKSVMVKVENGEVHEMFTMTKPDPNHFSKDYLEPGENIYDTDTKYALKAFAMLEKESKHLGIKIYNATRGGKLEVFERTDFDSILRNEKGKQYNK